jgi:DNA-binding SARP family transcriptional activator
MLAFTIKPHAPAREPVLIHLRLSAMGVLQRAGDEPAPLAPRDALLLAWLAIEGPTRRARLAALLWPDASEESARTALRQRVFQLRRRFGTELLADGPLVALGPEVTHDLDGAHSVLDGVELDLGSALLEWLLAQRRARLDAASRGLQEIAERAEQAHDWPTAISHAQRLLALMPLSEEAHRRLIHLHYLAGDRAAALLAFDRCEAVLKHEVGAAPSTETLALLRVVSEDDRPPVRPAAAPRTVLTRPPRLVGREATRASLADALADGALALVIGEAGIGKSRVLADAVGRCEAHGRRALHVRARAGDAMLPNALAARWLECLLATSGVDPAVDIRADLARLLPTLGAPSEAQDLRGERLRRALSALLRHAVRRGLAAVVIDDVHHADDASLGLLLPLAAELDCAWLLAMRGGEVSAFTRQWIELQLQAGAVKVELPPLSGSEVTELLESLDLPGYSGSDVAESLLGYTGGNPMFLLETVRASLADPAPLAGPRRSWPRVPGVRQLIVGRLARLSPMALNLARCAAVAGPDLSADLAAAVLGTRSLDLVDAWSELEAAEVLRGAEFAHDLIAEAARTALPGPIARSLHAEVARWMEQRGGAPARIASHWIEAGENRRAVPHLLEAARQAQAAWQPERAASLWEQAADLLREAGDRHGAFNALFHASHVLSEWIADARLAAYASALEDLAGNDPGLRAAAALPRLAVLVEARQLDDAQQLASDALPLARQAGRVDVEIELFWSLTVVHWDKGRLAEAAEAARAGLDRLESLDHANSTAALRGTRPKLLHALGKILSATGRFAEGTMNIEQARALARQEGHAAIVPIDGATLAENALALGDLTTALRCSAEAVADARSSRAGWDTLRRVLRTRANVLAIAGDPGSALALLEEAARPGDEALSRYDVAYKRDLHWLQYELGRQDLALKGLRQLHAQADLLPAVRLLVEASLSRLGETFDGLLDRISTIDDALLRAQSLCVAAPVCDPARILPLLTITAASARETGAYGLWLGLQAHAIAAMQALGRSADARAAAELAWQRIEDGVTAIEPFPRVARSLYFVWRGVDDDLARLIGSRASAWMRKAAMGLPPEWRDNYLHRAPVRLGPTALPL